jgi:Phosphotransferase enzyme family
MAVTIFTAVSSFVPISDVAIDVYDNVLRIRLRGTQDFAMSNSQIQLAKSILRHWSLDARDEQIIPLSGGGGFSGAELWRVALQDGQWCLRRWPKDSPTLPRLQWIHVAQRFARARGLNFVPQLLTTIKGESFLEAEGHLWELSQWMPGQANFTLAPSKQKLIASMESLARTHQTWAEFETPTLQPSPGVTVRLKRLEEITVAIPQLLAELERSSRQPAMSVGLRSVAPFAVSRFEQHASRLGSMLRQWQTRATTLQPCFRDIWHDHILFTGESVTGIVDYGAMNRESIAGDLARLIPSLVDDDATQWQTALRAYAQQGELPADTVELTSLFDQVSTIFSPMNWLIWIAIDGRIFDDNAVIESRVRKSLSRTATYVLCRPHISTTRTVAAAAT